MAYHPFRHARRVDADTLAFYHNDMTKLLQLNKGTANVIKEYGGSGVTGDDRYLFANTIDAYPYINLAGNSNIYLQSKAGTSLAFSWGGTYVGSVIGDANVFEWNSAGNRHIAFIPGGTGKVKFGTYVGTGDVVCNGNITIKDAAGTDRKLMTTA